MGRRAKGGGAAVASPPATSRPASKDGAWPAWLGPTLAALVGVVMLRWTWMAWPDVLIDFSREIYVPWQLAEGRTLYRDIAYFNGPLSPYLDALWFRLFGTGLHTLVGANLVLLLGTTVLLWRVLRRVAGPFAVTLATVVFLTTFAFSHSTPTGNYNFVCPYSHEMTHGFVLALGVVYAVARLAECERAHARWAAVAGACAGAAFLTRAELGLGALAAGVAGVALAAAAAPRARRLALTGAFAGPALGVVLGAFALLLTALPARTAWRGVLGSWLWVFDPAVMSIPYYRDNVGATDAAGNVAQFATWTGWAALALALVTGAAFLWRRRGGATTIGLAGGAALAAASWPYRTTIRWPEIGRPLPLAMLVLLVVSGVALVRAGRTPADRARGSELARSTAIAGLAPRAALVVLASALLLRMALNTKIYHIGFVLALPAALLAVVALTDWLPAAIERAGGSAGLARGLAAGLVVAVVLGYLQMTALCLERKTYTVGSGSDAFRADARAAEVNAAVEAARALTPGSTLAFVPQGLMVNYLARRPNPGPVVNLMPPEIVSFGEAATIAALEARPPGAIVAMSSHLTPDGLLYQKQPYAPAVARWILDHYRVERPVRGAGGEDFIHLVLMLPKAGGS